MAADLLVHDNRQSEAYELFERWRAKAPSDPLAVRHQVRFLLRYPTRYVLFVLRQVFLIGYSTA
jgi:hypothetical protein